MSSNRAGQLLVASQRLADPNFARTVVLIVQHDDDGIIGLVLNRPLDITVAEACDPADEEAGNVAETLHQGGPCQGPLMVLHSDASAGGEEVVQGVRFTAEREPIGSLMRDPNGPVRYFAGYSGWSPQQLEVEINEGAWLLASADSSIIFSDAPGTLWSRLTTHLTVGKWVDVDKIPDDPSMN